jgi:hypothetical protein
MLGGADRAVFLRNLDAKALVMTDSSSHPAERWAYRSAGELAQSLQKREISALELTDQFIARIEALSARISVFFSLPIIRSSRRRPRSGLRS